MTWIIIKFNKEITRIYLIISLNLNNRYLNNINNCFLKKMIWWIILNQIEAQPKVLIQLLNQIFTDNHMIVNINSLIKCLINNIALKININNNNQFNLIMFSINSNNLSNHRMFSINSNNLSNPRMFLINSNNLSNLRMFLINSSNSRQLIFIIIYSNNKVVSKNNSSKKIHIKILEALKCI